MINSIPLKVIQNRNLSILESIVWFLREIENIKFHNISVMLNRDERNIRTVYSRAKKKMINLHNNELVRGPRKKQDFSVNKVLFSIYGGKK